MFQPLKTYSRLLEGLRKHNTKHGLTEGEVLSEWTVIDTGYDPTGSGVCLCGKKGLK